MGRVPILRKLYASDYPSEKSWIDKLLSPVNDFIRIVCENLNNQLTIKDNMLGFTTTIQWNNIYPIKISNKMNVEPFAVLIGKVYNKTDDVLPTGAITPYWEYDSTTKTINILDVHNLSSTKVYDINYIIFGG